MQTLPLLTLLTALIVSPAWGMDGEAGPWELKTPTGKLSQAYNLYLQPIRSLPWDQERLDGEAQVDLGNGVYALRAAPWAWLRIPDAEGGLPRKTRAFFEMKEGWAERSSPAWELRIGNQIISWGAADQINPTDVWNPRDYYDPFQSTKLPVLVGRLKIHPPELESVALEVIGTPLFRQSRLPVAIPDSGITDVELNSSRWLLPVPTTLSAGALTAPLYYKITEANYPATWQVGGRLLVTRVGGWDFSGSAFYGVETTPRFAVTQQGSAANPNLPITLTLNPSFHRYSMWGADGSGSISLFGKDIGARFEIAYFNRDNSRALSAAPEFQGDLVKDDYIHGVAGFDYTFPGRFLGTVIYGNLQYVHLQKIEGKERKAGQEIVQGMPNAYPWDSDLVLYLESRVGSSLKLTSMLIGSLRNMDGMASPAVRYQFSDNLNGALSADFFFGSSDGFFGQFRDNRRVTLTASYSF